MEIYTEINTIYVFNVYNTFNSIISKIETIVLKGKANICHIFSWRKYLVSKKFMLQQPFNNK